MRDKVEIMIGQKKEELAKTLAELLCTDGKL